jgi:phosphosulfolactate synthase (CoM biosynthesis protein A)
MDDIPRVKSDENGFPVIEASGGDLPAVSNELIKAVASAADSLGKLMEAENGKVKAALNRCMNMDNLIAVNDSVNAVTKEIGRYACGDKTAMEAAAKMVDADCKWTNEE